MVHETSQLRPKRRFRLRNDHRCAVDGVVLDREQSLVGLMERKLRHLGMELDLGGNLEKVARVRAGHVRNAANLALPPKQMVVVKLGNAIEMDRVDGDDSSLAQTCEGSYHHVSAGRKGDGAVELDWRLVRFASNQIGRESW